MTQQIFINLAVNNLDDSMHFYESIGFSNNPQFSDDTAKCMVWSEHIFVMIMTHQKFSTFTSKTLSDTQQTIAGLYSLSVSSPSAMNDIMTKGLNAGGKEPNEPRDYSFMQQRTIEDPDGHTWEIFYMDMTQFPSGS